MALRQARVAESRHYGSDGTPTGSLSRDMAVTSGGTREGPGQGQRDKEDSERDRVDSERDREDSERDKEDRTERNMSVDSGQLIIDKLIIDFFNCSLTSLLLIDFFYC